MPGPYNHAKFRHPLIKSIRDIRCQKFVLSKKWTNVYQNPLGPATHQSPFYMPKIFVALNHTVYEKGVAFYTTILAPHAGGPLWGQSSPGCVVMDAIKVLSIRSAVEFRPLLSTPLRYICCQTSIVDFVDGVTDKKLRTIHAYHAAIKVRME